MNDWKKVLTFAFAMSIAVNLAAFDGGRSEEQEKKPTPATKIDSPKEMAATSVNSGEDYVVVMTSKDTTPLKVYQKYLRSADEWRQITEHKLLKEGVAVKVPKDMLKAGMIPAKVTKFWAVSRSLAARSRTGTGNGSKSWTTCSSRKAIGFARAPSLPSRSNRMMAPSSSCVRTPRSSSSPTVKPRRLAAKSARPSSSSTSGLMDRQTHNMRVQD